MAKKFNYSKNAIELKNRKTKPDKGWKKKILKLHGDNIPAKFYYPETNPIKNPSKSYKRMGDVYADSDHPSVWGNNSLMGYFKGKTPKMKSKKAVVAKKPVAKLEYSKLQKRKKR